jgi:hypothetical protein
MVALVIADHLMRQRTARLEWDEDEVQ